MKATATLFGVTVLAANVHSLCWGTDHCSWESEGLYSTTSYRKDCVDGKVQTTFFDGNKICHGYGRVEIADETCTACEDNKYFVGKVTKYSESQCQGAIIAERYEPLSTECTTETNGMSTQYSCTETSWSSMYFSMAQCSGNYTINTATSGHCFGNMELTLEHCLLDDSAGSEYPDLATISELFVDSDIPLCYGLGDCSWGIFDGDFMSFSYECNGDEMTVNYYNGMCNDLVEQQTVPQAVQSCIICERDNFMTLRADAYETNDCSDDIVLETYVSINTECIYRDGYWVRYWCDDLKVYESIWSTADCEGYADRTEVFASDGACDGQGRVFNIYDCSCCEDTDGDGDEDADDTDGDDIDDAGVTEYRDERSGFTTEDNEPNTTVSSDVHCNAPQLVQTLLSFYIVARIAFW